MTAQAVDERTAHTPMRRELVGRRTYVRYHWSAPVLKPLITVTVFLPFVFDRWPELHSFDVCQEPFNSTAETPPSLTIIDLTREAAATVDWGQLDLAGLIDLNQKQGISVWARAQVRDSATWRAAASL